MAEATEAFLDHERLLGKSPATLQCHRNALRQLEKAFPGCDVRDVTARDLEAYAAQVQKRVSRETAYVYLAAVRAFFRHLAQSHRLLLDPSQGIPLPRMDRRPLGRIFMKEEVVRVIESVPLRTPEGLRDRSLLEFLYSTGMRAGEAMKLELDDLGPGQAVVRGGKGGKDRTVAVGRKAEEWVRRYLDGARPVLLRGKPPCPALWVTSRGKAFGNAWFRRHVRDLGRAVGLEGFTTHAIRRSMATHLLEAGASPQEVSQLLGHEDLRSLSRYVKVAARDVQETHRKTHPRENP